MNLSRGVSLALLAVTLAPLAANAAAPPGPAVCFAPGTPDWRVEHITRQAAIASSVTSLSSIAQPFQFDDRSRWTVTASGDSRLGQGDPMTLTWSIVPDGTAISGFIGEPAGPSTLRAFLNSIYGSPSVWRPLFERVFARWGALTGITYVYEPNDDGVAIATLGGQLGVRGDIRIGGHAIDGDFQVAAYNFFPNNGDMVIDSPDSAFTDTSGDSLILRNMLAHEHGHGLGLSHVCPLNQTKLMEPTLSRRFDGPQHDDILAAQRGYGDRFEHNDSGAAATDLGLAGSGTAALGAVSIDDDADGDLYRFTTGGGAQVSVDLAPVGLSYLSGPQVGNCSTGSSFDSLRIHDLGFEVLDASLSPLASVDSNTVGQGESVVGLSLPGAGEYYLRVFGDATNAAQLYRLDLTLSGAGTALIFTDGFESGTTSAWSSQSP